MTGTFFNNSGKMLYNSGNITGPAAGGDITIHNGQPRGQRHNTATGDRPLVFVNYRGSDEAWAATVVWQVWAERIGEHRVFLDNRSIRLGRPFDEELLDAVKNSAVLLAVIGQQWYGLQPDGQRLIDNETDWVRREICHALTCNVPVMPILVEEMQLQAQNLPRDLTILASFQYGRMRQRYWRSDLADVIDKVGRLDERLATAAGEQW